MYILYYGVFVYMRNPELETILDQTVLPLSWHDPFFFVYAHVLSLTSCKRRRGGAIVSALGVSKVAEQYLFS